MDPANPTSDMHREVAARLNGVEQRYTSGRRALVGVLAGATRPLTAPEIGELGGGRLPQSSVYRNLTVLLEAGVVRRVSGTDELARFEMAEDLTSHHHHLLCSSCGTVIDVSAVPQLEQALDQAARLASVELGFEVTDHRIDLLGICARCS